MSKHLSYLSYVLGHKWHVFIECCKLGVPWLGIIHDWSKFLPSEWFPYVNWFYGKRTTICAASELVRGDVVVVAGDEVVIMNCVKDYETYMVDCLPLAAKLAFDTALFHHQKRNKHHWHYWIFTMYDSSDSVALEMPMKYTREMLADWRGASRAQGFNGTTDLRDWYLERIDRFEKVLHPDTREWLELALQ